MNSLNKVKIENTFRINASSSLEAAELVAPSHRDTVIIKPVLNQDGVFIILSTITCSTYHDVVFVDMISDGKYRVEIGSERLSEVEYLWLIGGDEAANEVGHFVFKMKHSTTNPDVMTRGEFYKQISDWADVDAGEENSNMVDYFTSRTTEYKYVNGKLEEVK